MIPPNRLQLGVRRSANLPTDASVGLMKMPDEADLDVRQTSLSPQLQSEIQQAVSERINLEAASKMEHDQLVLQLDDLIGTIVRERKMQLSASEQRALALSIADDMLGVGPLESLMHDDGITDILVFGHDKVVVEKKGKMILVPVRFRDEAHLRGIAARIARYINRRLDEANPLVDARMPDGSRVNIVIPPVAIDGTLISIRKFSKQEITLDTMVHYGSISEQMKEFLRLAAEARLNIVVSGGTGSGKALEVSTPILTPSGWRPIGELAVGDLVIDPTGSVVPVEGVYPQGRLPLYRVTFEDGRAVLCCDDHLWRVWTRTSVWNPVRRRKERAMGWRTVPLREIRGWFERGRAAGARVAVPLVAPAAIPLPPADQPLPAYVVGVLLGSSCLSSSLYRIFGQDPAVMERIRSCLPEASMRGVQGGGDRAILGGGVRRALRDLGVFGLRSWEKRIPDAYRVGTVEQRLELVRGLMDTGGTVSKTGTVFFTTPSREMAENLREVLWSLGAIVKLSGQGPSCTDRAKRHRGRPTWRLAIVHPDASALFTLERKRTRCRPAGVSHRLRIAAIERAGEGEAVCISVGSPERLYVAKDYVVTHNTTLLNAISRHILPHEQVVTIEDAAELRLQQPFVRRLETRPRIGEQQGEHIDQRRLVANALRMRPDRIILGEVRQGEAFDLLQAMNTGHEGSLTTLHANTPRDALARLENMILMAGFELPLRAIRNQIASAIDIIVQVERMIDGVRRVINITEVVGVEGDVISTQDLFRFEVRELRGGRIKGEFVYTNVQLRSRDKLRRAGLEADARRIFAQGG